MSEASPPISVSSFNCTQCGGELHPDEGQIFLTCPYCNSTVYLDKSQAVFHWFLASTLDQDKARASLARWMAGNQTVKDLDKKATLAGSTFQFFPMWYFKRLRPDGKEEILLEPAAATSISELRNLRLPAGDLRKYDSSVEADATPPTVPLDAVLGWLEERLLPRKEIIERSLVHIPLYTFKYKYQGREYTAVVEGGTGGVFANIYPAKAETPYRLIAAISALTFLCLATFPVVGAFWDLEGLAIGTGLCLGIGVLIAPILLGIAIWIAAKI